MSKDNEINMQGEYLEGEYAEDEYLEEEDQKGEYPEGEYVEVEYVQGQYPCLKVDADNLGDTQEKTNSDACETEESGVSKILQVAAAIIFIAGFISGFALQPDSDFNVVVLLICWASAFFSGIIFLGFAEIINLLQKLVDKK